MNSIKYIPTIATVLIGFFLLTGFWGTAAFTYPYVSIFGLTWNQTVALLLVLFVGSFLFLVGVHRKWMWLLLLVVILYSLILFFMTP